MTENINKTLAEQLAINEHEVSCRKAMFDFHEDEVKHLSSARSYIISTVDDIVSEFYEKQIKNPEISLLIGDSDTLRHLKGAMRLYIVELFSGYYGIEYVNRRLRIGKVHKQIGVPPKFYISAIWLLEQTIIKKIDEAKENEIEGTDKADIKLALNKLLMLDTEFVFDTYISSLVSEVHTAKEELQNYTNSLEALVAERTKQLEELSRVDSSTGLLNQKTFYEYLQREINTSERHHEVLSLVYFDLNNFKKVNDEEGHLAGDKILKLVGQSILASIREVDIGSRYGGDEFCLILPRTDLEQALKVVFRIIEVFNSKSVKGVTFSVGVLSVMADEKTESQKLVKEVDRLMYVSKNKSRQDNHFHITTVDGEYVVTLNQKQTETKKAQTQTTQTPGSNQKKIAG